MNIVAIVDFGMCNLDSVARAVEECGGEALVTERARDLETANRIILPGVGAFADAMRNIKQRALDHILNEQAVEKQIPFLGICLGMQLLATIGFEVEETNGLGFIPGEVHRLNPSDEDTRIPHVGWNEVYPSQASPLFRGIAPGRDFYFVHSYHFCPRDEFNVLARTPYAGGFISAVRAGSIWGVQFHPEKSQRAGFQLLKNFLSF
ncbi:MAG: imidazole glycerol phosphate synthase subunit HisH [Candidatus Aminicenantales bacterium]